MTDKKLCGLRSVPSLFRLFANGVHCCPPKKAKRLQRDCTSLRPSCWPLHFVGKCSLAPLARLGSVGFASLASLRVSLAPLVLGSGFACLGYAPPARLTGVRPPLRNSARSARSFSVSLRKKAVFSRKKSVRGNAHFSRKWHIWFLFRLRSTKT